MLLTRNSASLLLFCQNMNKYLLKCSLNTSANQKTFCTSLNLMYAIIGLVDMSLEGGAYMSYNLKNIKWSNIVLKVSKMTEMAYGTFKPAQSAQIHFSCYIE